MDELKRRKSTLIKNMCEPLIEKSLIYIKNEKMFVKKLKELSEEIEREKDIKKLDIDIWIEKLDTLILFKENDKKENATKHLNNSLNKLKNFYEQTPKQ